MRLISTFVVAAGLLCASSATAQHTGEGISPAEPGTPAALAGDVLLYFIGGRSLEETTNDPFNPFSIDAEGLLYSTGAFFITADYEGASVHEGEFSVYPQFTTPYAAFPASAGTPPYIPFAFLKQGACHAGYIAGYPVADSIFSVDLTDRICHAETVAEIVYASYLATAPAPEPSEPSEVTESPAIASGRPSDVDLDVMVWAAYNAAYYLSLSDPGYAFIRDGAFQPVQEAIAGALSQEGFGSVAIEQVAAPDEAYGCADPGNTVLRVGFTADGTGMTLVAASDMRQSSYDYDPQVGSDLDIRTARECRTTGFARTYTGNVQ